MTLKLFCNQSVPGVLIVGSPGEALYRAKSGATFTLHRPAFSQ